MIFALDYNKKIAMEYYIVQKKSQPYINGGFWCIDIIVSLSVTGRL